MEKNLLMNQFNFATIYYHKVKARYLMDNCKMMQEVHSIKACIKAILLQILVSLLMLSNNSQKELELIQYMILRESLLIHQQIKKKKLIILVYHKIYSNYLKLKVIILLSCNQETTLKKHNNLAKFILREITYIKN